MSLLLFASFFYEAVRKWQGILQVRTPLITGLAKAAW